MALVNAPPVICPVTGKISHATRDEAEAALKSVVWMNHSRGESARSAGLNVYPCDDGCDGWHFGHQHSIAIVWHYTIGKLAERILASGELRPRRAQKLTANTSGDVACGRANRKVERTGATPLVLRHPGLGTELIKSPFQTVPAGAAGGPLLGW